MRHTDAMRPPSKFQLVLQHGFHSVSWDSRPVFHEIRSGRIKVEGVTESPHCKDQPHRAEKKKKNNLHCRDVSTMRREAASATRIRKPHCFVSALIMIILIFTLTRANNPRFQGSGTAPRGGFTVTRIVQLSRSLRIFMGYYWVIMHSTHTLAGLACMQQDPVGTRYGWQLA